MPSHPSPADRKREEKKDRGSFSVVGRAFLQNYLQPVKGEKWLKSAVRCSYYCRGGQADRVPPSFLSLSCPFVTGRKEGRKREAGAKEAAYGDVHERGRSSARHPSRQRGGGGGGGGRGSLSFLYAWRKNKREKEKKGRNASILAPGKKKRSARSPITSPRRSEGKGEGKERDSGLILF